MMNKINTEFSFVEVSFKDEASKAFEIEDNVNLTLIIGQSLRVRKTLVASKVKKMRYSTEPRFRKYVKGYGFLSFAKKNW